MKALLSILREFADIPSDPDVVATALNTLGIAVESVDVVGVPVKGVVTARILRMEKHPDAAKVTRCWVDAGDGVERHVWCGASNMQPGDVVPLATLGTRMPDGREILRRGILGIDSEGMLCSAVELGVAEDANGLLLLPSDAPLGADPLSVLGIEHDVVFDLDVTRNRPECMGHLGIARDLAAHFRVPMRSRPAHAAPEGPGKSCSIEISAPDLCGLFTVQVISGVVVGPSPAWVQNRLSQLGMRPINNVVDASNLVMLEYNQPNHAYDADIVHSFRIRSATAGEHIVTLDGTDRVLTPDDLLICNAIDDSAVGLAGVMGGLNSEITPTTSTLALETAWFAAEPIRFTAQRHGLRSEASARFERGVDPNGVDDSVRRFVTVLSETCPDVRLSGGLVSESTPGVPVSKAVEVPLRLIERTLGQNLSVDEVSDLISPIGFAVGGSGQCATVTIPTWRPDCVDAVDIVEEIARHFGYDNLGKSVPKSAVHGGLTHAQMRRRLLRRVLVDAGLDEAMPNPFLAPGDLERCNLDEGTAPRIVNPLVAEESVLRTSLRPGLLKVVRYNQTHRAERIGLWEMGHVYPKGTSALPDEHEMLCIVVAGADVSEAVRQWGLVSDALSCGGNIEQGLVPEGMHPTRSASITRGKKIIGRIGEIDPAVLARAGIDTRVSCLELDLSVLLPEVPKIQAAKDINRLPSSDFDLAFVVPEAISALQIQRALRQAAGESLVSISLFDVYRSADKPESGRSLAFRLRVQGAQTLTDADVASIREKCIAAATKAGAVLR